MITLRSLSDVDFASAAAAALLGALLVLVPALAPISAFVSPEVLFGFAGGALVRWALKQPAAPPPAPPSALLADTLEPRTRGLA